MRPEAGVKGSADTCLNRNLTIIRDDSAKPAQGSGDGSGMRARLGLVFAFLGLLVAVAPIGLAQVPAATPIAVKSAPQGSPDVGIGAAPVAALPTDAAALLPPVIAPIPQ